MIETLNQNPESKTLAALRRFEEQISWEGDRKLYDLTTLLSDFYLYQIDDTVIVPLFSIDSVVSLYDLHKARLAIAKIYLEETNIDYKSIIVLYADQVPKQNIEQIILSCAQEKVTPWFLVPRNKVDYSVGLKAIMDGVDWKRTIEHFDPEASENKLIMEWD